MQNVITIPHIGSATAKNRFDMAMLAAQNLVEALLGKEPPNLVQELKIVCGAAERHEGVRRIKKDYSPLMR